LEARWEAVQQSLSAWIPEQMALAGASLDIGHNGEPRITRGLIKRPDLKALNKLRRTLSEITEADDGQADPAPESAPRLPQKLVEQLTSIRTCALRSEIANHPRAALALLVHALLLQRQNRFGLPGIDIRASFSAYEDTVSFKGRLSDLVASAPSTLDACFKASTDDMLDWLAILIAEMINLPHRAASPQDHALQDSADAIASIIDLDMARYWSAEEDFWLQAPKSLALETLAATPLIARMGVKDRDALLAQYAKKKKSELAKIASDALQGNAWLPDILITPPRAGSFSITPAGESALAADAA
jgi:ParB family chromosome partitioning protein